MTTDVSDVRIQATLFDYWARGEDLKAIHKLRNELRLRVRVDTQHYSDEFQVAGVCDEFNRSVSQTQAECSKLDASNVWNLSLSER